MPDNNRKILTKKILDELNQKYVITYNEATTEINVGFRTSKRVTIHSSNAPFFILNKTLKKKVVFSLDAINIWKDFQKDSKMSKYTLFDVNNAVNKLKIMYLPAESWRVKEVLENDFSGIKRI